MIYNMNEIVGKADIIFITLDTLRYDVAQKLWQENQLPNFNKWLPSSGWEKRHSPGSFTFAAHQSFFAGFLPTKIQKKQPRLFASQFMGSETTAASTFVFEADNLVHGLHSVEYKTVCIGGVGFFNKQTALSRVFPAMFEESYWEEKFGVTEKESTYFQLTKAKSILAETPNKLFLFINISALHQPNYFYNNNNTNKEDNLESHAAALKYVDSQLPILMDALEKRKRKSFVICCADHGTTYGEDGYFGHRLAHPNVWDVPYVDILLR